MKIQLIAVGEKMPYWVVQGYEEYSKRLPKECELQLHEISAGKRGKNSAMHQVLVKESDAMLKAISKNTHIVAMDVNGRSWSTEQLSLKLEFWLNSGRDVALLIGGPEGLSNECLAKSNEKWSLSALTLPHPLVRVVVAEAIYRAWSLLNHHPYHRGE